MAGESPDRSKKRESSAEPTSGSAGPVPEARSEAADPRLAVARDAGSSSSSEARGGVDTATKVFSVRDLPKDVREADGAAGEGERDGAAGSAVPEDSAGGDEANAADAAGGEANAGGDDRLRAAVAAWVASADEEPSEGEAEAEGDEGEAEGAVTSEEADGGAEGGGEAAGDAEAATEADAEPEGDVDAEPDAEAETGAASQGRADAYADAEAADAGTEADSEAGAASGADSELEGDVDAEPDAEAETGAASQGGADADADAEAADAGTEADSEAGADAELEGDADAGSDAEAEADSEAGADSEADAEPEGDVDAETRAGSAGEAGADADAEAEDGSEPGAESEAEPEADAEPEDDADGEAADDSEPEADDGTDADDTPKADKPPVDQPTAVFKAVRPSAPAVDQPTTMLKLGGAAKPEPKDADKPDEGQSRKPVADVERTSKFVALKPLDEPRPAATSPVPQVGPERTTQQPLPPKPPLDLLAELTNTPPPPQTPLRTAARRVKIWTPLVLLLAVVFAVVQAVRPLPTPELALTAKDSYTFEGSKVDLPWPGEGQGWMDVNGIGTMGNFGEQKPVAIGSVAKAMTAYVVLKDHPLKSGAKEPTITVDALAEKEGGYDEAGESTLNTVKAGDKLTLTEALSAVMIPSANNIARLLARWDAGSEKAFIEKMNATAKELGMKNTTYTDASGLKETTVSTAEDQVKLGNELVQIQALMDITKLPSWVDPSGQKWPNFNRLVPYNGAIGIKTGTTTKAGGNLLYAATKEIDGETVTVVGAILGQHTAPIIDTVNAVSKTAMLAAQDAITSEKILKKGDVVGYVDDQLGGQTPIVVTKDVAAVGWAGLKVKVSFASDEVPHTAKAGTKVGTLTVGDGSGGAVEVPVALQTDLSEPGFTEKLTHLA